MRTKHRLAVVVLVLPLLGCASTRIQSDFDRQADFSDYSSFAWYLETKPDTGLTEGPSQIIDGRIRRAVTKSFEEKGLQQANPDDADLLVTYYASLSPQTRFHTTGWASGWGWGPGWRFGYGFWPGWSTTTVHTYHEGTVIIDIIDRGKNQLVWRSVGTRVLGTKSHSDEKINQSMARMLNDFPPN